MAGLNHHSKLVTPGGLLVIVLLGAGWACYFFQVDVSYHLYGLKRTVGEVLRFIF